MISPVWLEYCARHEVAAAVRDFAVEVMDGQERAVREACAARVAYVAAACRTNGCALDSYDLQRLANSLRRADDAA